jgi:hypothetical protein
MSCERYAAAIVDYACGAEIAADARRHLETCEACRARHDEQRRAIEAIDAAIQQALAIEPSPQFERAVRSRIAQAPAPRSFAIWWTALAAAAAVSIVAGLAALRLSERTVDAPREAVARTALPAMPPPQIVPPVPPQPPGPSEVGHRTPPTRHAPGEQRAARRESTLPIVPVIVPADQSIAIERYLALVRSGVLDASNLAREDASGGEPPELVVTPLAVQPLTVSDVEIRAAWVVDRRGPQ